jgi:hypothetical protein
MRDLHQIINLHTFLDPRPAKPRAIDSCVRADLDVIVDLDNPKLLNFLVAAIGHFETKSVSSDHSAAVNDYARANPASLANCHMRINVTRGPDHSLVPDVAACANDRVVADFCSGFDYCEWLNRDALAQLNAWIDDRRGMGAGREGDSLRREFEHHLLECLRGIGNANLGRTNRLRKIRRNKNCRCAGFAQQADVFSICEEADFSRRRFAERCRACDLPRRIAD